MQSEAEQTLKKKQCMPKENARPEPFHSWFSDVESPKVEKKCHLQNHPCIPTTEDSSLVWLTPETEQKQKSGENK